MVEQIPYYQRVKDFRKGKKISQQAVADMVGLAKSTISDFENGKSAVSTENLIAICKAIGADIGWVMAGREYGITEQATATVQEAKTEHRQGGGMPAVVTVDSEGRDNVALVNISARAGYLSGYADPEFIEKLPTYRLPGVSHGTFRMFEIEGQSMYPTLAPRDLVVSEWVENPDRMRDERIYIIVTHENGIVIKRCVNRLKQYGFILAKSDNANKYEYPDLEIREEEIQEIWYARWYMSTKFPAPSDLFNRMTNLEVEMHQLRNLLT